MNKQYKLILIISLLLTAALFCYEWLYVNDGRSLVVKHLIYDLTLGWVIYTGMFFAILTGIYYFFDLFFGKREAK